MTQQQSLGGSIKQTWASTWQIFDVLYKALSLQWQASPNLTLITTTLYLVQGALPALHIWWVSMLIDRITQALQQPGDYQARYWLLPAILIVANKLVGMWIEFFAYYFRSLLEHQSVLYVQHLIFKKTAELDIAFFENSDSYNQLEIARQSIWRLHRTPHQGVLVLLQTVQLVLTFGLLLRYQPLSVLILIGTSIPYGVLFAHFQRINYQLEITWMPAQRMVNYIGHHLLGARQAVKEIRIFGVEPVLLRRFLEYSRERIDNHRQLLGKPIMWGSLIALLPVAGIGFVWLQAIHRTLAGVISLGTMTLLVQAANQAQTTLKYQSQVTSNMVSHSLYLDQLFDLLNMQPDDVEGSLKRPETTYPMPNTISEGITFEDVSFRYPGSKGDVLKHLSFTLNPDETVALVGENGAGKTTLVKLLARQFDPREGTISLDGRDLIEYDLDSYLRQIGVIFQDYVRYHLPVRDNIGFGLVDALDDDIRLLRAAELGGARELIDDLPDGLDTVLGKTLDEGTDLSGGQWQKLALSRAFMRDGQILILDEPTASLDALAEMEIYQRFADLVAGKIGIIVSHRFSTVKMANHILVLKDGELIEEGDHDSLMALQGHYAEMYTAQAQNYQ